MQVNDLISIKFASLFLLAVLAAASMGTISALGVTLTVTTDKTDYAPGELVTIFGTADPNATVTIEVDDSLEVIFVVQVSANGTGNYTANFQLSADAIEGKYTVSASSEGEVAETAFTVTEEESRKIDMLLEILEASKNQVEAVFYRLEGEGIPIPDAARDKFEQGLLTAAEAVQLRDQGNYEQASEKAVEAMQIYSEAIQIANEVAPPTISDTEVRAEKAIGLEEAIERAYDFSERIESIADEAEEEGYNVTTIRNNIEKAEILLENATASLGIGEIDEAAQELASARSILGQSMGELHKITKDIKAKKAEVFLRQTEERLSRLEERMEKLLSGLPSHARATVSEALQNARNHVLEVSEMLEAGNVDEAIQGFEDVRKNIGRGVEEFGKERPSIAEEFVGIQKLENTLSILEDRLGGLEEEGVEVSGINERLERASSFLEQAIGLLEEGNTEEAESIIEEVEGILDQVDDHIDEVEEAIEETEELKKEAREKGKAEEAKPEGVGEQGGEKGGKPEEVGKKGRGPPTGKGNHNTLFFFSHQYFCGLETFQ